ncbi:DUF2007 domain-containing protein [bacterium]|nr:DUF2007 domain-containing protein [bacterium]
MNEENPIVTVFLTDYMKAIILKGKLESEGIPVVLQYETLGAGAGGILADGLGEVSIMVPKSMAEKAKEIIEETDIK